MMRLRLHLLFIAIVAAAASHSDAAERPRNGMSFRNDVMAVLSKSGCNAGVCHGNASGKGGFKLSLRGQDPAADFRTLTRAMTNRRTNALDPDRSLLLLKPTMRVAHEGGKRFDEKSPEYRILRAWIAAGTPADPKNGPRLSSLAVSHQQEYLVDPRKTLTLRVMATFSDGSRRDITRLAVYEPAEQNADVSADGRVTRRAFGENTITVRYLDRQVPVRVAFIPARPGFVWKAPPPANVVDRHVFRKLRSLRINPSPVADDSVFLRRAYLDLLGILPTAEEAKRFVADKQPDKRAKLVDRLLQRPEFADFWALKWSDLLRNEEKTLDRKGVRAYYAWIRGSIAAGKPLNEFARELIAARGSTYKQPAANYYRAMREPLVRAESTAQLFLGIRLQCAKCHNHPFDRWTQDDYYGWANNFARVKYKVLKNKRRDKNDKHEFDGEQVVFMTDTGDVTNPRIGQPTSPRFLGNQVKPRADGKDRLQQLADWVADPRNEQFAKTQVNRIWFHLMGRGIVDPIDDFRSTNPPSNPELLDALAKTFVAGKFDLRRVIRTIMASKTYQLSSRPNETNRDDVANFSHAIVRRLTAEQTLDALSHATGVPVEFNGYPPGTRAGQIAGVMAVRRRDRRPSAGDQLLKLFGKPPRLQSCECERSTEATLNQTFQLVSGPLQNELLTHPKNRLTRLLGEDRSDESRVTELYWSALARPPTPTELKATVGFVKSTQNRRAAYEDVLWAIVNANEFQLRR